MANYNKCPNGHYYDASLKACPYCSNQHSQSSADDEGGTKPYDDDFSNAPRKNNETIGNIGMPDNNDGMKTVPIYLAETDDLNNSGNHYEEETVDINNPRKPKESNSPLSEAEATQFFDEEEREVNGKIEKVIIERSRRKLVGWLVSYDADPMGIDYRLYEGKNVIGRDPRVQITIQDPAVSDPQAIIRFLRGKFAIKDEMSSHGTFVNGNDIELNAVYLNDGDIIQVGHTTLKFRSAL